MHFSSVFVFALTGFALCAEALPSRSSTSAVERRARLARYYEGEEMATVEIKVNYEALKKNNPYHAEEEVEKRISRSQFTVVPSGPRPGSRSFRAKNPAYFVSESRPSLTNRIVAYFFPSQKADCHHAERQNYLKEKETHGDWSQLGHYPIPSHFYDNDEDLTHLFQPSKSKKSTIQNETFAKRSSRIAALRQRVNVL